MLLDRPRTLAGMTAPIALVDGTYFDAANPDPAYVPEAWVLAHALARINRFAGHGRITTNVAHHSLVVATLAICREASPRAVLGALLHDTAEAFIGDVPSPVKRMLGSELHDLERGIQRAVAEAFGIHLEHIESDDVAEADRLALALEARYVLPVDVGEWGLPAADELPTGAEQHLAMRQLGMLESLRPADTDGHVEGSAAAWERAVTLTAATVRDEAR